MCSRRTGIDLYQSRTIRDTRTNVTLNTCIHVVGEPGYVLYVQGFGTYTHVCELGFSVCCSGARTPCTVHVPGAPQHPAAQLHALWAKMGTNRTLFSGRAGCGER